MRATPATGWAAAIESVPGHLDRIWPDTDPEEKSPSSRDDGGYVRPHSPQVAPASFARYESGSIASRLS